LPDAPASLNPLWTFTVVAALVTTAGTLCGHFLKEIVLARSFEQWKAKRALDALYRKYRDPIVLSAIELANRFDEICREYPTDFLASQLLGGSSPPPSHNSERTHYFKRYKLESTAYRLAAFLAWLELYRQDLVFMDADTSKANVRLQGALAGIREALADGHLNCAANWERWADALIFREEQRAIGEALIATQGSNRVIIGYGAFQSMLTATATSPSERWISVTLNFLVDPSPPEDFRLERYRRMLLHLVALVDLLAPQRLTERLRNGAETVRRLQQAN
jgi:hypothetical protein